MNETNRRVRSSTLPGKKFGLNELEVKIGYLSKYPRLRWCSCGGLGPKKLVSWGCKKHRGVKILVSHVYPRRVVTVVWVFWPVCITYSLDFHLRRRRNVESRLNSNHNGSSQSSERACEAARVTRYFGGLSSERRDGKMHYQ